MSFGQGLGLGHVEGQAKSPGRRVVQQRRGVGDATPRDVDEQRAVAHRREERVVDQTRRLFVERHTHDHDVRDGQELG